jgi:diketogulonate reductase-like aldo/keto reductase
MIGTGLVVPRRNSFVAFVRALFARLLALVGRSHAAHGMPKVTEDPAVLDVAGRLGASPAQVGLAWLLAHRANVLLIPGTSSVAHLEENMQAGDVVLSDADLAALAR